MKKTIGQKKAKELLEAAKNFFGVTYSTQSARLKLTLLIEELELLEKQLAHMEKALEQALALTGFKEIILSIPGVGILTAVGFLGNTGDPLRFTHPRQISKMAGYNLIEEWSSPDNPDTKLRYFC